MNFWDFIVWMLWVYVFIAYLFLLFSIFSDLFRDHKLNGWWKALWIIFLIFFPIIGALVYLIARGRGMAERGHAQAVQAQQQTDAYIRQTAGTSASDEIAKAAQLRDAGTITQAEYEQIKAKALS
ncbi:SHOCT domain-containing protein [Microbacterium sp. X-17]|uniref:SHOCT domain-containing protein n=1 Tax=Microbacterium sp. X-17 TaxID=3144404 RepID=UPI0031F4F1AE